MVVKSITQTFKGPVLKCLYYPYCVSSFCLTPYANKSIQYRTAWEGCKSQADSKCSGQERFQDFFYLFLQQDSGDLNLPCTTVAAQQPEEQESPRSLPIHCRGFHTKKIRKINTSPLLARYTLKHKLRGGRQSETTQATSVATERSRMCQGCAVTTRRRKWAWSMSHKVSLKEQRLSVWRREQGGCYYYLQLPRWKV